MSHTLKRVIIGFAAGLLFALALFVPRLISPVPDRLLLMPFPWPGDLGFVLIDRLELDERHGLDLQLPRLATSDDMIQAFRNKVMDVLTLTLDVAVNLAATEPDIRTIYAYNESAGADGMVARAEIQRIQDLRGRKVGAETNAPSHYLLMAILKRAGLTVNDITFVDVQSDEVQQALTTGRVDAVVTWEPTLSSAVALPGMHLLTTSKDYPGLILNVIIVRQKALQSHPKTYVHLVEAWDEMRQICETDAPRCWTLLATDQKRPAAELEAEAQGIQFLKLKDNRSLFRAEGGAGTVAEQLQATYAFLRTNQPNMPEFDPTLLYDPSVVLAAQE